jgi:formamidopyrimidine-DNA glycosylase
MPELPEIEVIKKSLDKMLINAKIIKIKINNRNLRYKIPSRFSQNLVNQKVLKISRRSKYLIFHFKKKILLAHMGMSGKLVFTRLNDKKIIKTSFYYNLNLLKKHNHIYFKFNNGLKLIYNDVRRFGFFKLYNYTELNKIVFLKNLGPEPFSRSFNLTYFINFIKNKEKKIKSLLMDQSFVCGLGNIYANEALFISKINPLRQSRSINRVEANKLILSIKKVLKFSILKGGSSIKDFKNTGGKKGTFQEFFNVYGQNDKKCSRISCNGKVNKIKISRRSTYYCNKCQT